MEPLPCPATSDNPQINLCLILPGWKAQNSGFSLQVTMNLWKHPTLLCERPKGSRLQTPFCPFILEGVKQAGEKALPFNF